MLKDLGLFAGFSLIGASLCSLIFLPHFIETKKEQSNQSQRLHGLIRSLVLRPEYNKWLIGLIAVINCRFFLFSRNVSFEPDMMQMNYMTVS